METVELIEHKQLRGALLDKIHKEFDCINAYNIKIKQAGMGKDPFDIPRYVSEADKNKLMDAMSSARSIDKPEKLRSIADELELLFTPRHPKKNKDNHIDSIIYEVDIKKDIKRLNELKKTLINLLGGQ